MRKIFKIRYSSVLILLFLICSNLFLQYSYAEIDIPKVYIGIENQNDPSSVSMLIKIIFILTVISIAPAILVLMTSFTRIVVVFAFLRHALGTQQTPSNQIIAGLALFLTVFIMMPVWKDINNNALQPYLREEISQDKAIKFAIKPLKDFMMTQTREKDLALFYKISKMKRPKNIEEVPATILIPAFVISELKTAFIISFLLYIPFLIIDMVVASVLLSMGMMMLPPILISLPFKIMLFVLVDGWNLLVSSLVKSFFGV